MFFSAVSMVSSFEADDDTHDLVGVGERNKTNNCRLRYAILTQFDLQWKRSGIVQHRPQLLYPNRKETVRYYLVISTHTLRPVHWRRRRKGGGERVGALLADTHGFWCDWAFMVLLADQHRKRSCLAGASTCFRPSVQSISSKSHKALSFSRYLVQATLFFTGRETFTGKNRHMPV